MGRSHQDTTEVTNCGHFTDHKSKLCSSMSNEAFETIASKKLMKSTVLMFLTFLTVVTVVTVLTAMPRTLKMMYLMDSAIEAKYRHGTIYSDGGPQ